MFDIKWIRENGDAFDAGLKRRGLDPMAADLIALDAKRRDAQTRAQEVQTERNAAAKQIGQVKAQGGDATDLIETVSKSKALQADLEAEAAKVSEQLDALLAGIPNLPYDDVPDGASEDDNVEIRTWGTPPAFDFTPKEHFDIGEALGQMDFETAAKMSGARFVLLSGALARMERALAAYMLDLHTSEDGGYTEVNPPALVKDNALFGTGQLPKFAEDLFKTSKTDFDTIRLQVLDTINQIKLKGSENYSAEDLELIQTQLEKRDKQDSRYQNQLWLIPTAEVPLTNIVADTIIDDAYLPRRYTAMTWCFRSEAGSAGRDTRGMIRQHQFTKVEMVSVTRPEDSDAELERMTAQAEKVLQGLGLPYRVIELCTGDMGFSARKTYDLEVWLPGQDMYREISSCSTCGDFQARRMKARYRPESSKATQFVHTLNGSGVAVGRCLVAVLENYQQADGSVKVPDALVPYMGGLEVIPCKGA